MSAAAGNESTEEQPPTLLLVPGMWHGGWAWDKVEKGLAKRGMTFQSLTFPGKDRIPGDPTFVGHCAYLHDVIGAIEGPVIVVAHSYGGAVATEAADMANVAGLVFISAFCLEPGESVAGVVDADKHSDVSADTITLDDGYLTVDRAMAMEAFYHDCDPADAESAFSKLTPEYFDTRITKVTRAAWKRIPSHYVICTEDRAVPLRLQERLAARVNSSSQISSSHSPMISQPVKLIDLLEGAVRDLG